MKETASYNDVAAASKSIQVSSEHDDGVGQHICRVSTGKYVQLGVVLTEPSCKLLHYPVDLL